MSKLPRNVRPQKLIRIFEGLGFVEFKAKGSHVSLKHADGRWTQIAVHSKTYSYRDFAKDFKPNQVNP